MNRRLGHLKHMEQDAVHIPGSLQVLNSLVSNTHNLNEVHLEDWMPSTGENQAWAKSLTGINPLTSLHQLRTSPNTISPRVTPALPLTNHPRPWYTVSNITSDLRGHGQDYLFAFCWWKTLRWQKSAGLPTNSVGKLGLESTPPASVTCSRYPASPFLTFR